VGVVADIGYIKTLLGAMPNEAKRALEQAFTYLLGNLTLGAPEEARRAKNFQWYWFSATTSSVANTEFSIAHGLGKVPSVVIPILPLNTVGGKVVNLEVSRAADSNRIYLKSPSTSAPIVVLVE
jgi:hypothetical protein